MTLRTALLLALAGAFVCSPRLCAQASLEPAELADDLARENEALARLIERMAAMERQVAEMAAARGRGIWSPNHKPDEALASAPARIANDHLTIERSVADAGLVYSVATRNAPVLDVLDGIARTSGRELRLHTDIGRESLAGRLNLAVSRVDMTELLEMAAGIQGMEAVVDERSISVGPARALSDQPVVERLRERAMASYQRAIVRYPGSADAPEAYLGMGRFHQAGGFHTAAIQTGQMILDRYPNSPAAERALLLIAESERSLGRPAAARSAYYRYVDRNPTAKDLASVMMEIGETFLSAREYSPAVPVYEEILRAFPASPEAVRARFKLAQALARQGDWQRAMTELQRAEELGAADDDADLLSAECLMQLKRYGLARVRLKNVVERSASIEKAERAYCLLGDAFLAQDNAVAAIEIYQGAARQFPDGLMRKHLPARICRAYIKMGLHLMVERRLKTMPPDVLKSPDMRPVLLELARYRLEAGDPASTLALLNDPRWGNDSAADPEALLLAARAHLAEGAVPAAIEKAERAARLSADGPCRRDACVLIGECYTQLNQPIRSAIAYSGKIP